MLCSGEMIDAEMLVALACIGKDSKTRLTDSALLRLTWHFYHSRPYLSVSILLGAKNIRYKIYNISITISGIHIKSHATKVRRIIHSSCKRQAHTHKTSTLIKKSIMGGFKEAIPMEVATLIAR